MLNRWKETNHRMARMNALVQEGFIDYRYGNLKNARTCGAQPALRKTDCARDHSTLPCPVAKEGGESWRANDPSKK